MAGAVKRRAPNPNTKNDSSPPSDAPTTVTPPKKRGRSKVIENGPPATTTVPDQPQDHGPGKPKRAKLDKTVTPAVAPGPEPSTQQPQIHGTIYTFGMNEVQQLGFEAAKRKFPALVPDVADIKFIDLAAGGMHTVALSENGEVWTWGLNDDCALGRGADVDEDLWKPGKVNLPVKIVQVSAGDSHSVALGQDGKVYVWGVFNDANGKFGLLPGIGDNPTPEMKIVKTPAILHFNLSPTARIIRIRSGNNHIVLLSSDGEVFTAGSDYQSLGRTFRNLRNHGSERDDSLTPKPLQLGRRVKIAEIWTGGISTICRTTTGDMWVFGLNNTKMLGIEKDDLDPPMIEKPVRSNAITEHKFKQIAMGNYHSLGLTEDGKVFSWGKFNEGALGLGKNFPGDTSIPHHIPLKHPIRSISAGGSVSYAINFSGEVYAWGFGVNWQLGNGEDEENHDPALVKLKITKDGETPVFISQVDYVSANAQHTGLIGKKGLGQGEPK